jgi:hypothetical protein
VFLALGKDRPGASYRTLIGQILITGSWKGISQYTYELPFRHEEL